MKEIDQENMDTAIVLGDAVCSELGICCENRGRVIFQIYKKLDEMKSKRDNPAKPDVGETRPNSNPLREEDKRI